MDTAWKDYGSPNPHPFQSTLNSPRPLLIPAVSLAYVDQKGTFR